jgi:hypothetical protein
MINIVSENIENATITVSGEDPNYTFETALNDTRLSRVGRTVSDTAQWILFSFSAAVSVDVVGIFANNFTSGATVKIQANVTDSWGAPSIDQSLTYTKDNDKSLDFGRDVGVWSHQFSSTESYQYWRIYLDDSSNPDSYLEMGYVFLDEKYDFPGMSVNQIFTKGTTSQTSFSESGQAYGYKKLQFNGFAFSLPSLTDAQKVLISEFYRKVDITTPYMLIPWENSLDVQRPIYAINVSTPEFQRIEGASNGVMWRFNMEIREVY